MLVNLCCVALSFCVMILDVMLCYVMIFTFVVMIHGVFLAARLVH